MGSSESATAKIWTPANVVTLARICLVPVFVIVLVSPWPDWLGIADLIPDEVKSWIATIIFVLISCTDWIDGYLARSRNEVTDFGKLIDPLADKILVAAALIALVELQVIPSWPVLIILTREFIISGIRMVAASKGIVIAASWYGKAKTVFQIIAIVMFMLKDSLFGGAYASDVDNPFYIASWAVMVIALVLTVLSMIDYISNSWSFIFSNKASAKADVGEYCQCSFEKEAFSIAERVIGNAASKGLRISTAESLTGGLIAASLTAVAGSSSVVNGGIVTYVNQAKSDLLGVDANWLETEGPINGRTAEQMACGSARQLKSDMAIAVTGIAGPTGSLPGKPVGTVFVGTWSGGCAQSVEVRFDGDRETVRQKTVIYALKTLDSLLEP